MEYRMRGSFSILRDRQGVALPIAVFALLIVTVLITGVLLTSSTELAVSGAHQDATTQLYTAEGAIEDYATRRLSHAVAYDLAFNLPDPNPFPYTPPGGSSADGVTMTVTQLSETPNPGFPEPDRTYALTATPVRGGRTVTAMTRLTSKILQITDLVPIWSGTKLALKGDTNVWKSSDKCPTGPAAVDAIQYSGTTAPTITPGVTVQDNDIQPTTIRPLDYISATFGTTLGGLMKAANDGAGPHIYWGPLAWGNSNRQVDSDKDRLTNLNWGCPKDILVTANNPNPCVLDGDENYYPLVGIDARSSSSSNPWGRVTVNGNHGQGVLVVTNGDLDIQGNFQFCGVIVVEGSIKLNATGGGAQKPKIEGAVIALGQGGPNADDAYVGDNTVAGSPQISYNRCCIQKVNDAFTTTNTQVRSVVPTFAWTEVVR